MRVKPGTQPSCLHGIRRSTGIERWVLSKAQGHMGVPSLVVSISALFLKYGRPPFHVSVPCTWYDYMVRLK